MESFSCKTEIFIGNGSLRQLKDMGIRRLLLVTDPFFSENGTAQRLLSLSGAEATEIFDKITPDPTVELAAEGTAAMARFDPDTVVALGGGSTIDCAKAMVYFFKKPVRLIAVPTTSGSGSEVTDFAVLTHKGVKHPLVDKRLLPHSAILDFDLLAGLPPALVADTGFDVLSHSLEAYVATGATAFSDALARDAFSAVLALLGSSYRGDQTVRGRIHQASTMAGMAFQQAGLGMCHALSHVLGGAFHLPHGRLNAILLPAVIRCNAHICGEKYAKLARWAGISGAADTVAVRNLCNALCRLRQEMQLPRNLREAGIPPEQVWNRMDSLVAGAMEDPCCRTNPLPVEAYILRRILSEVAGRG